MPLVRLFGEHLLPAAKRSAIPTLEALSGASAVALYFSASWCPPCRGFTPQLKAAYNESLQAKGLRCVLVSSDHDEESFKSYFGDMPWLALPYQERARKEALSAHFGVRTIPTLALVDPLGRLLTTEARDAVVRDPQGREYPWVEPAVRDLATGEPGRVNTAPSVILLCEGSAAVEQDLAKEVLQTVAQDAPLPPERQIGDEEFSFTPAGYAMFVATGGPLAEKVRELAQLPAATPGSPARLLLLDIPGGGAFYTGPQGKDALTEEGVRKLLDDYAANRLERQQLS